MEIPTRYEPKEAEARWQAKWKGWDLFKFNPDDKKQIFSIDTPPPTVSGTIHIGHVFSYSQADFIARFWRMKGFNVFYPFGFDDNGLPTERFVEKVRNVRAADMQRKEFQAMCLEETARVEKSFRELWSRVAISCDWSLLYSTMSKRAQKASQLSFIELFRMGRVYRKTSPVSWCIECQTAIAQVEQEDKEKSTKLVHIRFDVGKDSIAIATTRPELMPACVAVFVNGRDKRYMKLVGKKASIPFFNRQVDILANDSVDMEFGTGAVYHCTFGDADDIKWVEDYRLPVIEVIGKDGKLSKNAGPYAGLYVKQAREAIIRDLEKEGRVGKIEERRHAVNVHERCQREIEYIITTQWYIRYLDLKDEFLDAGAKLKWHPEYMKHRYDNWVKGLKWDWCISRQRYFGVPFPVWYCRKCGSAVLADESQLPVDPLVDKPLSKCKCGSADLEPEKDILDTWATSSLTPQINGRWKEDDEYFKKIFPMSLRPQAHDIITFWLFNTVVKARLHNNTLPWKDVMISGYVLDPKGLKMSKSKGNVVTPEGELDKHSADALRFWAASSKLGEDLPYSEKELVEATRFMTKLWNASRFVMMNLGDYRKGKAEPKQPDLWILSRLNEVIRNATSHMEGYEYSKAKDEIVQFFWHVFCDDYLEMSKHRMASGDGAARFALYETLLACTKMMAPFMPHISEEIYQMFFAGLDGAKSVHVSSWPQPIGIKHNKAEMEAMEKAVDIIHALRKYKADNKLPMNATLAAVTIEAEGLEPVFGDIAGTMKAGKIESGKASQLKTERFGIGVAVKV